MPGKRCRSGGRLGGTDLLARDQMKTFGNLQGGVADLLKNRAGLWT